ncbi:hypothetical protein [Streptomyces sp. NPDC057838]|uniref:hypothetical protein n=1 Tax=unclassified Streptomyces TaxID=2593676 RepID=UPI0036A9D6C2
MTSRDPDLSHPLEQVTGEKDVHPEEEEGTQPGDGAGEAGSGGEHGGTPPENPEDAQTP